MSILKIEMFGIQKIAMTLLFIGFHFPPIYKADSVSSWTFSFNEFYMDAAITSNYRK